MSVPNLYDVAMQVVRALEDMQVRFLVVGSLASSAMGTPRASLDADIVADLRAEHTDELVSRIGPAFYVSADMIREAVRTRSSFNVIHIASGFKVDVFVLKNRAFDRQAFERVVVRAWPTEPQRTVPFCSAEDIILHKLEWYRMGGEVSERQWSDILGVLQVQGERLNREYLRRWATDLQVVDLLERAWKEATS